MQRNMKGKDERARQKVDNFPSSNVENSCPKLLLKQLSNKVKNFFHAKNIHWKHGTTSSTYVNKNDKVALPKTHSFP